jgi:O-antigen/teichoic acid export membrane protein
VAWDLRRQGVSQHYGKAAVRTSLLHFLFGKAFNAVVSVVTLIALARWLSTADYGGYVALVALQAMLLAISNLGVETTTERFLPEFRTRYADEKLLGFVLACVLTRLVTLLLLAGIGVLAAGLITTWLGLPTLAEMLRFWMLAVFCYGALSFACVLLEAMLKQKQAQACMSVYLGSKLALIVGLQAGWQVDLARLVACEVLAGLGSAALALTLLTRQFHHAGMVAGWRLLLENRDRLRRFAVFNYAAQCVFQLFSADVLKLLVTRLIGVAGSASYGFAASLADMVQRYLPATLLQRLIKPVFVSRYVRSGDFEELNQMGLLILKLNLLILVPVIALSIAYGGELLGLLTQGRFVDAHWLLVGVLCLLIPSSHQAVLSMLAGTMERNAMQLVAGLAATIGLPLALMLIPGWGAMGAIAAAASSALVYNLVAVWYLRRSGLAYAPDWRSVAVFLVLGAGLSVAMLGIKVLDMTSALCVAAVVAVLLTYLALVRALTVFRPAERATLNALLPRPVFIF